MFNEFILGGHDYLLFGLIRVNPMTGDQYGYNRNAQFLLLLDFQAYDTYPLIRAAFQKSTVFK